MKPNKSSAKVEPSTCSGQRLARDESCPLCGKDNQCRIAKGHLYKGLCWCEQIVVPGHILHRLVAEWVEPACLCRPCLETVSRVSNTLGDPDAVMTEIYRLTRGSGSTLQPEDYYFDGDGKMVFTAAYHLKRGTCCGNDCRHCPY